MMIVEALEPGPGRSWPSAGTRLIVLEIEVLPSKEPYYRVERNDGTPVLLAASEVRIVDGSLPASWNVSFMEGAGVLIVGPASWQTPGFWERFFDSDAAAGKAFTDNRRNDDDPFG